MRLHAVDSSPRDTAPADHAPAAAPSLPVLAPLQVLHLPRHKDREAAWQRLVAEGQAEFAVTVDAQTLDVARDVRIHPTTKARILRREDRFRDDEVNSVGPVACALSHMTAARAAAAKYLATGAAAAVAVLEDDLRLDDTLGVAGTTQLLRQQIPRLLQDLEEADPEWDVLVMYRFLARPLAEDDARNRVPRHPRLQQLEFNQSNAFLVWSARGVAKLDRLLPVTGHFDWMLSHMAMVDELRMYSPRHREAGRVPQRAIQLMNTSTLGHTTVKYCTPLNRGAHVVLGIAILGGILLLLAAVFRYRRYLHACRRAKGSCERACPVRRLGNGTAVGKG